MRSTYVYAVKNIFRSRALVNTVEVGGKWPGGELASSKSQSCQLKLMKLRTRLCIVENITNEEAPLVIFSFFPSIGGR